MKMGRHVRLDQVNAIIASGLALEEPELVRDTVHTFMPTTSSFGLLLFLLSSPMAPISAVTKVGASNQWLARLPR